MFIELLGYILIIVTGISALYLIDRLQHLYSIFGVYFITIALIVIELELS